MLRRKETSMNKAKENLYTLLNHIYLKPVKKKKIELYNKHFKSGKVGCIHF